MEYKYFDARTNRVLYSTDLTNAAWIKRGASSVTKNLTSPKGDANDACTVSVGSWSDDLYQVISGYTADSSLYNGIWIKQISTNGEIRINTPTTYNGAAGSWSVDLSKLSGQWERLTKEHPAVTVINEFVAGTTGKNGFMFYAQSEGPLSFGLWNCQQEEGELTWDIETTSATVTKPAGVYSRLNPLAFKRTALWCASTNKVTCRKANPTDTTNLTKSGDAAATLAVVDDSAELAAAGLSSICTSGKVYKLDNSGGSAAAYVYIGGGVGNTNKHSISCFARGSGTGEIGLGTTTRTPVTFTGGYRVITDENRTPPSEGSGWIIVADAGAVVYFILPQLEEGAFCTPPIFKASDGTDPLTSLTRPNTKLVGQSAGVLRGNNLALMGQVIPGASGQSNYCYLFSSFIDVTNYLGINTGLTGSQIRMRKVVDSVASEVTPIEYPPIANTPFQWQAYLSSSYGMGIRVRSWLGMAWSAWSTWATNANTDDAPIAETFEIGSRNDTNRFDGNYPYTYIIQHMDPKARLEQLTEEGVLC
jgi:hypothetical protein